MSNDDSNPFFLWTLFQQLVRRNFAIGLGEYEAAMLALRAGFGWSSRDELKRVLCALWSSSREETSVLSALFDQLAIADWDASIVVPAPVASGAAPDPHLERAPAPSTEGDTREQKPTAQAISPATTAPSTVKFANRLPELGSDELPRLRYSHVFLPQYPVSYRSVAQTWRRLRRPIRKGPATELDVAATVARRSRLGVSSPPVLRPMRRNSAQLLVLVDRKGSMEPFHGYVDEVCDAIRQSGRLGRVGVFYFHDTPLEGADARLLEPLDGQVFPSLDPVLDGVPPLTDGTFFADADLFEPIDAAQVLSDWARDAAIVVISDAGAARRRLDVLRVLDTIASLTGLQTFSTRIAWLNPLPAAAWTRSSAAHIARHVPMFTMDRDGMHRAVNVLRGQPIAVARPLPRGRPLPPAESSMR